MANELYMAAVGTMEGQNFVIFAKGSWITAQPIQQ